MIKPEDYQLSLAQKFRLNQLETQLARASQEQLVEIAKEYARQLMVQQNCCKALVSQNIKINGI